jgi:hypothetical protein
VNIAIIILMLATLAVLIVGVALMTKGGVANKKYSNKLMIARVALQGVVIAIIGIMLVTG